MDDPRPASSQESSEFQMRKRRDPETSSAIQSIRDPDQLTALAAIMSLNEEIHYFSAQDVLTCG